MAEMVNHPDHYGGEEDPYEAIKVIEAWKLGFHLGSAVKYIARTGKKGDPIEDLEKARWYLDREIERRKAEKQAAYRVPGCLDIGKFVRPTDDR